jgi:hypothetical protein
MMSKFSVDVHFPKSANCGVFGWIGEAEDKQEAQDRAIADARACGFKGTIKVVVVKENK